MVISAAAPPSTLQVTSVPLVPREGDVHVQIPCAGAYGGGGYGGGGYSVSTVRCGSDGAVG